jgi:hypothetical protein
MRIASKLPKEFPEDREDPSRLNSPEDGTERNACSPEERGTIISFPDHAERAQRELSQASGNPQVWVIGKVVAPHSLTPQSNSKLDNRKFSGTTTAMRELPAVTKAN